MKETNYNIFFKPTFCYSREDLIKLWAYGHLTLFVPHLRSPCEYTGKYNSFLPPNIRIIFRDLGVIDFHKNKRTRSKAILLDSNKDFDINFHRIKTDCCDVFIWFVVWCDVIKCWVMPSFEIENSRYFLKYPRYDYIRQWQFHLHERNIAEFDKFLVNPKDLEKAIKKAYKREVKYRQKQCAELQVG